jgi:hypothetical protein
MAVATENFNRRVRWLRNRGEEVRAASANIHDGNSRRSLLLIAASYETMAIHLETAQEHLSLDETG